MSFTTPNFFPSPLQKNSGRCCSVSSSIGSCDPFGNGQRNICVIVVNRNQGNWGGKASTWWFWCPWKIWKLVISILIPWSTDIGHVSYRYLCFHLVFAVSQSSNIFISVSSLDPGAQQKPVSSCARCRSKNPSMSASESYRQGMNELAAVLLSVMKQCEFFGDANRERIVSFKTYRFG